MGMSTHVVGIKPADEKYRRMLTVYKACQEAAVSPPDEVMKFFGDEPPDEKGVVVHLDTIRTAKGYEMAPGVEKWKDVDRGKSGYEIDLRKLDPDIKILRVYNSW